jgi:hypothetical protein
MSNLHKSIIAVLAVLTLIVSGYFLSSNKTVEVSNTVIKSASSVSSQISTSSNVVVYSSSLTQTVSSLSQNVSKTEEKSRVSQSSISTDPGLNPIQDIPNVTKLSTDKSIYHQYIKDYLACPTKFYQPLNGGYIYDGLDQYQYKCIPQSEADKCPQKTTIYGHKPLLGSRVATGEISDNSKVYIIEKDKYYCANFYEITGSVSLPMDNGYFQEYFPIGLDSKLPGYFTIPKSKLPNSIINQPSGFMYKKVSFAAIPITSFSQEDQQYISKNFKTN